MSKILKFKDPNDWDYYHYLVWEEINNYFDDYSEQNKRYILNDEAAGDILPDENGEPYGYDYDFSYIPKEEEYLFKSALQKMNEKLETNYQYPED